MNESRRPLRIGALAAILVALLATPGSIATAEAASGSVRVNIDLPQLVVLYYYDDLNVEIPESTLASLMAGTSGGEYSLGSSLPASTTVTAPGMLTGDAALIPSALDADPENIGLVVQKSWAVKSIGRASNNTRVSVALASGNTTLTGSNGGSIVIDSVLTRRSGVGAAGSEVQFAPTGLGGVAVGDLVLDLDISGAVRSGSYSATGGQIIVTADNL